MHKYFKEMLNNSIIGLCSIHYTNNNQVQEYKLKYHEYEIVEMTEKEYIRLRRIFSETGTYEYNRLVAD